MNTNYNGAGCGKNRFQRSQQWQCSSFLLNVSTAAWTSLFHKITVQSWHSSSTTTNASTAFLLKKRSRSTKLFGSLPLRHSYRNRCNSCKPHLNIFAFSGRREHHLIETWSNAQFEKVSATQLGYSWHPSAATSVLTQDSSQPRRRDN